MGVRDGFCRTGSDGLQRPVCIDPAASAHARRWPTLTLVKPGVGHPAHEAGKGTKGAGSPPALSSQCGGSWLDHFALEIGSLPWAPLDKAVMPELWG